MPNVVGTLTVNLEAQTASFSGDLGKAAKDAEAFGQSASAAGKQVDFSMMEARGGMALMGETMGVHIPRHLQTLIAEIPGVGVAFGTLLPIIGAVFAVDLIEKWIEKSKAAGRAVDEGFAKSLDKLLTSTDELHVSIEKSKMAIDKLEGKTNNGAALAIAEARVEADKLAESLSTDAERLIKLMEVAAHGKILTGLLGTSGKGQAADVMKGYLDALAKIPRAAKDYNEQAAQAAVDAHKRAASEIAKNDAEAAKQKAHGKSDLGNLLGGTDFTVANQALQEVQVHLSGVYDKADAAKEALAKMGEVKGLERLAEAAKRADAAFRESSRIMREGMNEMKEAAIDAEKAEAEEVQERIRAALYAKKAIETVLDSKQKEADQWVKITEKMIQEDTKHAALMADLAAKDGGASKGGEEKRYDALKKTLEKERALLTSSGTQRVADEKKIDNKEEEEAQKHQNKMDELTRKGEQHRADMVKQFGAMTIFQHQSAAAAIEQIGKQELSTFIDNTIQALMVKKDAAMQEKLIDAESSARSAFKWAMSGLPFPVNAVVAPIAAGAAFSGVMAFEQGGFIPGSGPVPVLAHGGETVISKKLTDQVAQSEGRGGRQPSTIQFHIHGIKDADGFKASQTQIGAKAHQMAEVAARKNR
jgi:hypothetical protein